VQVNFFDFFQGLSISGFFKGWGGAVCELFCCLADYNPRARRSDHFQPRFNQRVSLAYSLHMPADKKKRQISPQRQWALHLPSPIVAVSPRSPCAPPPTGKVSLPKNTITPLRDQSPLQVVAGNLVVQSLHDHRGYLSPSTMNIHCLN